MSETPDHVLRNRAEWDQRAADYAAAGLHGWAEAEPSWGVWSVPEEQAVEEVVAQLRDEAGQQEPDDDLLVDHLPVPAEVVRDIRPCRGRGQALTPAEPLAGGLVMVASVSLLGVLAGLDFQPG